MQPTADETLKHTDRKAAVAEVIHRNFANLAYAVQPKEGPSEEPEEWTTVERTTDVVLSRKTPFDTAKEFAKDELTLFATGKPPALGTFFYQKEWWHWNGSFFERAPEQRIVDMACNYLDNAKVRSDEEGRVKFKPTTKDLTSLMTFLRTCAGLDDRTTPPRWLDGRASPKPEGLLAFRNWLVDVTTGKTYNHDPRLWLHDGVDFDYNSAARCPHWEWFLKDLFPTDEEARNLIEEQLGYGMTIDNQFEKAGLWVGPPRSGRGTIAHIQELLVGVNGYTSLNIHTWHRTENSRMGMIGKRVGIFHDVRLKRGQQYGQNYDPGGLDPHSKQLLLEFISGDASEIGRKYFDAWKGKPFIKFLLISNDVPNFNDEVLITRFNIIEFTRSYLGKEKPELKLRTLPAELPGIANRCLAAYRELLHRGHFIEPNSGLALLGRVKAKVDPWVAFMAYWDPDPDGDGTQVGVFVKAFRHWCLKTGTLDLVGTSKSNIIQQIKLIPDWEWLKSFRPSGAEHSRQRRYCVKLKPGVSLPAHVLDEATDDE
jgi:putative DNA primase/helicase